MENDLISRSDAVGMMHLCLNACNNFERTCVYAHAIKQLEKIPTADVAPVVHAHWIDTGRSDGNDNYDFVCCRCKHTDIHSRQVKVPYCWFCGARMDEQEET